MTSLNLDDLESFQDLDILSDINLLKAEIDSMRPLDSLVESKIMQKFRLEWNYNSNAIEGNSLDYGETTAFLMHGVTAKGKPLKDYLDIKAHNEPIDYLTYLIQNKEEIGETDIRSLHKMLLVEPYDNFSQNDRGIDLPRRIHIGEYKTMPNHVKTITGEIHYYATPEDTPIMMHELVEWFRNSMKENHYHPVVIASIFHHRFTLIHPFDDGNGRMSRLLMNLILMQHHYPPVVIKDKDKNEYYLNLSQADAGNLRPFISFIGRNLADSLSVYLKGAKGENIDEPTDLRKKVLLFKRELDGSEKKLEIKKSTESIKSVFDMSINPLLNEFLTSMSEFNDLFFGNSIQSLTYNVDLRKWIYSDLFADDIYNLVVQNSEQNEQTFIVKRLVGFKVDANSFSLDLILIFTFDDLIYSIKSILLDSSVLANASRSYTEQIQAISKNLRKYYHQSIPIDERTKYINSFGEHVLEVIKNRYKDDYDIIDDKMDVLYEIWRLSVDRIPSLTSYLKQTLTKAAIITIKTNNVRIQLPNEVYDSLPRIEEYQIENEMHQDILRTINLKFTPFVDIYSAKE